MCFVFALVLLLPLRQMNVHMRMSRMRHILFFIYFFLCLLDQLASAGSCKVEVEQGWLEGEQRELATRGGKFYSFKGIPYAEPPVGKLRFRAPRPPLPWKSVRNATEHGAVCPHFDTLITKAIALNSSEDCLFLNVYTPDIKPNTPFPVMFWIHGGGFKSGSGNNDVYGPDFLVQNKIVLVTINYRLEVLGFLCLDTEEVPGNAGMKDQVAALRWVHKNIHKFGGDPNKVTISGWSAGGASVSGHLMSPMSQGLYRRAILQSGAITCDSAIQYDGRKRAFSLGKKLGLATKDPRQLFNFFQSVPVDKLINVFIPVTLYEQMENFTAFRFSIVNEKKFKYGETFFSADMMRINDVEILIGHTTHEGIMFVRDLDKQADIIDTFLEFSVPKQVARKCSVDDQIKIGTEIRNYHFSGGPVTNESGADLVNYYSFSEMNFNIIRFLEAFKYRSFSRAYFYSFSFMSERSIAAIIGNPFSLKGVTHGEDVMYLFHMPALNFSLDSNTKGMKMVKILTTLWTNFVKYGNPTPDKSLGVRWSPYTVRGEEYLDIGEKLVPGQRLDRKTIEFWRNIYKIGNVYRPNLFRNKCWSFTCKPRSLRNKCRYSNKFYNSRNMKISNPYWWFCNIAKGYKCM